MELCYDPEEITNGVGGQNSYIYNICLVGNGSFTAEQERVFDERTRYWMDKLGLPASAVKGHNEFTGQSTNCPAVNMAAVRARLSTPSTTSTVEDKRKFSSPTLQKETEASLASKAHRQIVVDAAIKAGANTLWTDKLSSGALTDADMLGLAVKCVVAVNK